MAWPLESADNGPRVDLHLTNRHATGTRPCWRTNHGDYNTFNCREYAVGTYTLPGNAVIAAEYLGLGEVSGGGNYYVHAGPEGAFDGCSYQWPADTWTCRAELLTEMWTNDHTTDETAIFLEASEKWGYDQATLDYVALQVAECFYSLRYLDAQQIANSCSSIDTSLGS